MEKNKRYSHVSKTHTQRVEYNRYLSHLDSPPTIDESIDFDSSSLPNEDQAVATSSRVRAVPINQQFLSHFQKNWIMYPLTLLCLIAAYLLYDNKANIEIINNNVSLQQKEIDKIDTSINGLFENLDDLKDRLHKQDITIQGLLFRFDLLNIETNQE
jgi:hypothetical protein